MKMLISILFMFVATVAQADYTLIVPQKPGGGTSVWAQIVATEWEKHLGERIVIQHIPGARDIPGFNKWHNEMLNDSKTIMVSHGGNGVSFLQEEVDYDYRQYASVGLMNLNIIAAKTKGIDFMSEEVKFAAGSGMVPEAFAMTMLLCGPDLTVEQYTACFKDKVRWVSGMSGGQRRLAFKNNELNGTRENPAAYKKHVEPNDNAELWFHHGILNSETGEHGDDPNYPGYQFEILFEKRWGVAPSGRFYDAYKLVKSFRDGMQKALWVSKDNPNLDILVRSLDAMAQDPESAAIIQKSVGDYSWKTGANGDAHRDTLMNFVTLEALSDLVEFNTNALGLKSVFKPELGK